VGRGARLRRWRRQRALDRSLRREMWAVWHDKAETAEARQFARRAFWLFASRTWTGIHTTDPAPAVAKLAGPHKYGLYCGVGHGVPQGERRPPLDRADAACQDHDIGSQALR